MNKEQVKAERKTLLLSFLAGLCGNATLAVFTSSAVPFSIFPVIAFGLAVYCLYQEYLSKPMTEGTPAIAFACFLAGAFGYSGFMRAQLPDMGSNFLPLMITLGLLVWVAYKLGIMTPKKIESTEAQA
ncbi:YijD family membrane protein [Photobacterium atrarenae]|uniref:YijD family membrane protein n=1 Tax=Photobacterium atrarenae TaxID=865757 RepID=A0ABY5GEF0_9GAMM|nr:YijD family membrane protein [Photobacterium atrarenae]UTV27622.1 YijD family membrane protein [Photobacterium atrarenae]